MLLILSWLFFRHELSDTVEQIKRIKKGDSHAPLKKVGFSDSNQQLVNEVNDLVISFNQTVRENKRVTKQNKEMIASISHDFRTPLTSMIGYLQMIDQSKFSARDLKYFRVIEERTQLISKLIDEFYFLSLLDADDYQIQLEEVNPITLIQEQVAQYYEELSEHFQQVKIDLKEEPIRLETGRVDFERIVQNLIKNAYTHGKGVFQIRLEKKEQQLCFVFANDLPENSKLEINRIFDRNYQGEYARTAGNAGLGLSIAKQLAEKLGFSLTATLKENQLQFQLKITFAKQLKNSL